MSQVVERSFEEFQFQLRMPFDAKLMYADEPELCAETHRWLLIASEECDPHGSTVDVPSCAVSFKEYMV